MTEATLPPERAQSASPFSGLAHFTADQADLFFGRESERTSLIANLRAARLTLLYAATGVGKSSLLRAGVFARLRTLADARVADGDPAGFIPIVFDSWRDDPVKELIDALERAIRPYLIDGADVPMPRDSLEAAFEHASTRTDSTCLVMLDQAEEYLLYRHGESRRPPFSSQLARCINRRDLRANFLLAVREDAYASIGGAFVRELPAFYANHLALRHLDRAAGQRAITGPVERFNTTHPSQPPMEIEPALVDAVLDEVRTGQVMFAGPGIDAASAESGRDDAATAVDEIETPYLQLVMQTLWAHERAGDSRVLRLETFRDLGGASAIVRDHMHGVLDSLPPPRQAIAADIFNHLVTPSGTKIVHRISDLAEYGGHDRDEVQNLVDDLLGRDQRLLRPIPSALGEGDEPRVEIFHDVLAPAIVAWRALREETRLRAEADAAAGLAAQERRRATVFRAVAGTALLALAVAIVAIVLARRETDRARSARDAANSRQVAGEALDSLSGNHFRAGSLLAIAADRIDPTAEARHSLVTASIDTEAMMRYVPTGDGGSDAVATSPDGQTVAVAGDNGTVALIDLGTGAMQSIRPTPSGQVASLAYSPSGRTLALGIDDRLDLWSIPAAKQTCSMKTPAAVESVAYGHHGGVVATGTDAGADLWSARTCQHLRVIARTPEPADSVAFTPDDRTLAVGAGSHILLSSVRGGRDQILSTRGTVFGVGIDHSGALLAAASSDRRVILWRLGKRSPVRQWIGSKAFEGVAFSPDGRLLAAASDDGDVHVFNTATGSAVATLIGHSDAVNSVSFGANGTLASGGDDGTMIAWRVAGLAPARTLSSDGQALSLAFDPQSSLLATSSRDSVRLFRLSTDRMVSRVQLNPKPVEVVAFDPALPLLGSADHSGTTAVVNLDTRGAFTFRDPGQTYALAFSPDGRTIATGGTDDRVTLRALPSGRLTTRLGPQPNSVEALAYDRQGRFLAAADEDGTITVWRRSGYRRLASFRSSGDPVNTLAFNATGTVLASAGQDGPIDLWNPRTGHQVATPLAGPANSVYQLVFDPQHSTRLLSVSQDGSVMVWDTTSGLGVPLERSPLSPMAVAIAPNGRIAAAGAADGQIGLFAQLPSKISPGSLAARLCRIVGGNLSVADWHEYEPDLGYRRQCGR